MMPRRILYLAWAPFFSGAERALLLTLRALDPAQYVPHVLAGTDGEFAAQVRDNGISCDVVALQPFDTRRPISSARSIASVLNAAIRHRASLIHANEAPSFQPGGYAARVLGIPAITHVRFPAGAAGYRWFLRSKFSLALFVSRDLMVGAAAEAPELFEHRSDVLHDCVEPQSVWDADELLRERQQLGLPIDRPVIALTGQIAEVKGIWDFVAAAHIVRSRNVAACFAVLGDDLKAGGAMRRAMEERVASLGLSGDFRFLGFRRDAPRIVQAFDIITVPSHVEPLGNATLEAMAAGRPVVGSAVGGIPEMVVYGVTGILVPPRDPERLADALCELATKDVLRVGMSRAARRRSIDAFGFPRHRERLQAHYDRLCAGGARQSAAEGQLA